MDGQSRQKLIAAGYAIFRQRNANREGAAEPYEIRESSSRGEWVVYGSYPTKATRLRAWNELAKDQKNMLEITPISDTEEGMTETTAAPTEPGTGVAVPEEATATAVYERKLLDIEREHKYLLLRTAADTKIKGAAMREKMERLLRVMHLREIKETLKESGEWSRYCQDTGTDIKNADYEIGKLGDYRDELLLSFSAAVGYDINKIKYLTGGNSEKLGVTVQNGQVYVKGELISLTPEDVSTVVSSIQEEARQTEERAAAEKVKEEKAHAETRKALKKAERELKKIKGDAKKKGVTPEEEVFLKEMDEVRADFDTLLLRLESIYSSHFEDGGEGTPRMKAAHGATHDYIFAQVMAAAKKAEERSE